jgi:tetratricopeptide (TPR) repeat protein
VLAGVTGVLYWFTRPKGRDVFWDVTTSGPAEMLARVEEDILEEPGEALAALRELLRAYPDYQPAWLVYAEWHFDHDEYEAALTGYKEAVRLGPMGREHYRYAATAAEELGRHREAEEFRRRAGLDQPRK